MPERIRGKILLGVIVLQIAALGYMAGHREYIVRTGDLVYLRTAPIDPRDPFRGDFVRLRYGFSSGIGLSDDDAVKKALASKGQVVYGVLAPEARDLYEVSHLTLSRPTEGLFMKGRTKGHSSGVRFGIEQFFTEQGQGREMEKRLGTRRETQIPLEIAVALGTDGTAIISGYRWSELGIKTEVVRINRRDRQNRPQPDIPLSPLIAITLENVSERPLSIANPGRDCGFRLVQVRRIAASYTSLDDRFCSDTLLRQADVLTLDPGENRRFELDMTDERWHLMAQNAKSGDNGPMEMGAFERFEMFRVIYRSPLESEVGKLENPETFWLGRLPGASFNATGRID